MLDAIVRQYRPQLNALAHAWLDSGARAFGIYAGGEALVVWPENGDIRDARLRAPIKSGIEVIAELRVAGDNLGNIEAHLEADAGFISSLLPLERELNSIATELIDTRDQLVALYQLTQATRNSLDIQRSLEHLAMQAAMMAKAEGAFFYLRPADQEPWAVHYPEPNLSEEDIQPYLRELVASKLPYLSTGVVSSQVPGKAWQMLLLPINVRGVVLALIGVLHRADRDFMSPEIKLVQAIGEYAGAHIENLLLFKSNMELTRLQTEMELARRVQVSLLPKSPPSIPGLDIWAGSQPASQVGGDFYDFISRPGDAVSFVVGDISGKGMPAALLMSMTRTLIRTETNALSTSTPEMVLRRTNAELYNDFTELVMFSTVFMAQYDQSKPGLVYANAGHSPVIYCPRQGRARLMKADGVPIGILPMTQSRDHCLNWEPGDLFVIGTDGLTEARNSKNQSFGYQRLISLVEELSSQPAEEIARQVYQQVRDFSGGLSQQDDQTLVIIKRLPL